MKITSIISFPHFISDNGSLCVYESDKQVPFKICRVFTVSSMKGDSRGNHAHKKCDQLMVCLSGQIKVTCDNGSNITTQLLKSGENGLFVPSGIWAKQDYLTDQAVLMVLCDRNFEENDYIRDFNEFKKFVSSQASL